MSNSKFVSKALFVMGALLIFIGLAGTASAVEEGDGAAAAGEGDGDQPVFGLALGAGLAIGLTGLATAIAQKDIGSAAIGAIAEDPSNLGRALVFVALPETIVIFGLVIAILLNGQIGAALGA